MLRIPLPEYDGFALREACKGLPAYTPHLHKAASLCPLGPFVPSYSPPSLWSPRAQLVNQRRIAPLTSGSAA